MTKCIFILLCCSARNKFHLNRLCFLESRRKRVRADTEGDRWDGIYSYDWNTAEIYTVSAGRKVGIKTWDYKFISYLKVLNTIKTHRISMRHIRNLSIAFCRFLRCLFSLVASQFAKCIAHNSLWKSRKINIWMHNSISHATLSQTSTHSQFMYRIYSNKRPGRRHFCT